MKLPGPVFVILAISVTWNLSSQINGFVYDAEVDAPLSGSVIICEEEQTLSGMKGEFSISLSENSVLIISHLGYKTDTIPGDKLKYESIIYLVPDYSQLEQVTIHGPLLQMSLMNLPSSVSMLHSKELTQTQGISYMQELNRLPGVFVHSGTINTNRVTIRGIGSRTPYASNRVKAYFNDIPITSGDGTTTIEDIDPAMINTVEIIKGSKSALYGSGLGGIIMLSGREYLEEGFHGSAGMESGSFSTHNPRLGLEYKKGNLSTSATYSYARSNGWRQNSNYYRHSANVNANLNKKRNKTYILLHLIDLKAYIPSSLDEETFLDAPESAAPNWLAIKGFEEYTRLLSGIRNEWKISDKFSNSTVLFLNYYNGYESRPFNILTDDALQGGMKIIINFQTGGWRFRTGIEFMLEKYNWHIYETLNGEKGQQLNSYEESRNPFSLLAHGSYTFSNGSIIETGLSYNYLSYKITDLLPDSTDRSGNYSYQPVLSPFLGINIPLGRIVRMYASLGHGFSYPSVEETLMPDGQANPNLKPEKGLNIELGTRISAFEGKLFADVNVYLMMVNDLLVTERESEDIFYGENAGKTRHIGFEVSTSLRLNEKSTSILPQTRLDFSLSLADNRFTYFTDDGTDYSGNALPGVPSTRFFAGTSFSYPFGIYVNIHYSYTGKQYLNDGNNDTYNAFNLVNLKLGYQLKTKKIQPDFYFGIQNLFNTHYASMLLVNAPSFGSTAPRYYYPGIPQSFYAGILIKF